MGKTCTCRSPVCALRVERGLEPFCQMDRTRSTPRPANEFGSYRAAADFAHGLPGKWRVRSTRVSGGPPRFVVEPAS